MDYLTFVLAAPAYWFVEVIQWIFAIIGMVDTYMYLRFRKHPLIDKTASWLNYQMLKWGLVIQLDDLVEKLPFLKKDISEITGVRDDDGRIT